MEDHRHSAGNSTASPLVSALVLGFNQEGFIRKAVEGAFAQTWTPLEIVLSDDCSTDRTFEIMREMAAAYSGPHRVVLNRNERNLGIAGNVNRLMEVSTGAFVLKFDGDDISLPTRAERLARAWLDSGGRSKLVFSEVMRIDADGEIRSRTGIDRHYAAVDRPTPLEIIRKPMFALGASSGWAREVFDRFGPIRGDAIVEDTVLPFRAAVLGEIAFVDEPLVLWRTGGSTDPDYSEGVGRAQIYGHGLHINRVDLASMRAIALDIEKADFPQRDLCRRWCAFQIECRAHRSRIADASTSSRLFDLPRSIGLSLRHRSPCFTMTNLRYLFDRMTMSGLDRKAARQSGERGHGAP
jgi:glycosyltransferase involved in cell wall biosynthesis